MSAILNPLHPGTLFIQKKLGQQFLASIQITMPPNSVLNISIAPPAGKIWILVIGSHSTPRDAATNNPVISPNIFVYFRHSMVVSANIFVGLESYYRTPWSFEVDVKPSDPLVSTTVNNTALTIVMDVSYAMIDITEDKYEQYMRLWNGIYNLGHLLGGLRDFDLENLLSVLKSVSPAEQLPTPIPAEVVSHPTMGEDTGKPIKRIEIP